MQTTDSFQENSLPPPPPPPPQKLFFDLCGEAKLYFCFVVGLYNPMHVSGACEDWHSAEMC